MPPTPRHHPWKPYMLLLVTGTTFVAGGISWLFHSYGLAEFCWAAGAVLALLPTAWTAAKAIMKGHLGVDVIAVLSLIGTLAVHEYLAGALIAVMLSTGQSLEQTAERRATKDLRLLTERMPRLVRRRTDDDVVPVAAEDVVVGDRLIIGPGDVVPVDGELISPQAVLDESALTGESVFSRLDRGQRIRSGVVNAGGAVEMRAAATVQDSTYAGIVRLAQDAAAASAPVVRLADRAAAWFLPLVLAVAGGAWIISGSAVRAVSVLVVATPCPLLLAAPVAIVSGMSRASRLGVVVRGGAALETLGRTKTALLDKTGTVTTGRPQSVRIVTAEGWTEDEVLRRAASAEQVSSHVVAHAILDEARRRQIMLSVPDDVSEDAGIGVHATVDGHRVSVGSRVKAGMQPKWAAAVSVRAGLDAAVLAWVDLDSELIGAILLQDTLRTDAPRTVRRLRDAGITRVVLLTGDHSEPAARIGALVGVDEVRANQTPADKVAAVRTESLTAVTMMVGDGINDAPALAAADVGVAMGAHGSSASAEVADVILSTDRIAHLADAMTIARRSRRIAVQSAVAGMALSVVAMGVAAAGLLAPAWGALLQEVIDLAVILNALRALGGPRFGSARVDRDTDRLLHRFADEHDCMRDDLVVLRDAARHLANRDDGVAIEWLHRADDFLRGVVLPHEKAEDTVLYPALARPLGSSEATATMSRMHAEIADRSARLHSYREHVDRTGTIDGSYLDDVLACLYGLHTLLELHFAQEEENYFVLASDRDDSRATGDHSPL